MGRRVCTPSCARGMAWSRAQARRPLDAPARAGRRLATRQAAAHDDPRSGAGADLVGRRFTASRPLAGGCSAPADELAALRAVLLPPTTWPLGLTGLA
jgi:hypothetical protein